MGEAASLIPPSSLDGQVEPAAFLFAAANTPWVYALSEKLASRRHRTTAVALYDWMTYHRSRLPWPNATAPPMLSRESWVFPSGYMGNFEPIVRPFLRMRWRRVLRDLGVNGRETWVVCPYPWLVTSLRGAIDDHLIYFNLDPYELYRPERAKETIAQECELVRRSRLIVCLAQSQVAAFQARFPDRAADIRHLPLAAQDEYINPAPGDGVRLNTVGYVGNLIDRVDWLFVRAVATLLPKVEFVFVGRANVFSGGGQRPNWARDRDEALSLPNVRQIPAVPQNQVAEYYWSFGISWIPYAADHSFNIGSCPTKIMDGLASGRPVLSTDIPECRMYREWIKIMVSPQQAVSLIEEALKETPGARRSSQAQVDFVRRQHTWERRASTLEEWTSKANFPLI